MRSNTIEESMDSPGLKAKNICKYYAILQKDKLKLFTNQKLAFDYFNPKNNSFISKGLIHVHTINKSTIDKSIRYDKKSLVISVHSRHSLQNYQITITNQGDFH
jgi:hypothetical protein